MKLNMPTAEIFVPDGKPVDEALARTTHLCIAAHQDDIEIMAYHGVLQGFGVANKWFTGVVVTNGAGSPRDDVYANFTDEEMQKIRKVEQKKAAYIADYAAQGLLDYTSSAVKDSKNSDVINDIKNIIIACRPEVIYTHNLADKHDTHVSVALRVITAIRQLPADIRPKLLLGCEVWRDLDWMTDEDKVVLDVSAHENLAMSLLGVFDSQICGGKRYDLAIQGRRRSNATFFASHGVDESTAQNFAMDLTPLIQDDTIDTGKYLQDYINRFSSEVSERLAKFK
jgi:LmbE family N-acetylglucosaminyl deacetylase